ncbi:neuronal acetylcholine receptor subunit beta-3-like [Littorina saxatilis]|uniref:neuronal acetylcholine receptor subunit beta-3-like n=1 Tax=Littorina saxatilis TaxID=31220 RepID=UPI0038B61715
MVGAVILLLVLQVVSPVAGQSTLNPGNDSDYFNSFSATRTAYYRWRSWILNHPAVLQKVPPAPKATAHSNDDKLNVTVKITPVTVLQVDQARQTVQMAARMEFWWTDPAFAVTEDLAESFTDGNVSLLPSAVTIPSDLLWLPPLLVVEGVNSLEVLRQAYRAEVEQDGTIAITLPYVLSFSCRFDISNYPFDEHDCPITVVDPSSSVNVLPSGDPWESALSQTFGVEGEWDLTGVRENVMFIRSDPSFTQCVVHLRRKTTFFVVLTIVPLVVTSYLNVLVFLLPPDLGDKASYLVTVTISMSVFVSFFNTDMPRGIDKMPAIFRLLIFVTIESLLTLGITLFMLRRGPRQEAALVAEFLPQENGKRESGRNDQQPCGGLESVYLQEA